MTRLRVMMSFHRRGGVPNPYITQLISSLHNEDVEVLDFSWKTALLGNFDVFHVHWPEQLVRSRHGLIRPIKWLLLALLVLRVKVQRKAVVRTLHNLNPHEASAQLERWTISKLDSVTTRWITLNQSPEGGRRGATDTILHGHYRDWFAEQIAEVVNVVPGRALYFGEIRPFKNVPLLVETFKQAEDPSFTLRVVGKPQTQELKGAIVAAADDDRRISLDLRFVPDDQLAREIREAQVVVLPYGELHNSGALLLAMSLGCPALVVSGGTSDAIAAEVGGPWVRTFDGLTADVITSALRATAQIDRDLLPPLPLREWREAGRAHRATYLEAIRSAKQGVS